MVWKVLKCKLVSRYYILSSFINRLFALPVKFDLNQYLNIFVQFCIFQTRGLLNNHPKSIFATDGSSIAAHHTYTPPPLFRSQYGTQVHTTQTIMVIRVVKFPREGCNKNLHTQRKFSFKNVKLWAPFFFINIYW